MLHINKLSISFAHNYMKIVCKHYVHNLECLQHSKTIQFIRIKPKQLNLTQEAALGCVRTKSRQERAGKQARNPRRNYIVQWAGAQAERLSGLLRLSARPLRNVIPTGVSCLLPCLLLVRTHPNAASVFRSLSLSLDDTCNPMQLFLPAAAS